VGAEREDAPLPGPSLKVSRIIDTPRPDGGVGSDSGGVDDAVESLTDAISPSTLLEWASMIEKTVQKTCGKDLESRGVLGSDGNFDIEFDGDSEDFDCLVRGIRQHLEGMHPLTRSFYEQLAEIYGSGRGREDDARP
jgi:hypothetical protein